MYECSGIVLTAGSVLKKRWTSKELSEDARIMETERYGTILL